MSDALLLLRAPAHSLHGCVAYLVAWVADVFSRPIMPARDCTVVGMRAVGGCVCFMNTAGI